MLNKDRTPPTFDLPCDLDEFLSRRRNMPLDLVTEQLGDWLVSYEAQVRSRRTEGTSH